MSPITDKRMQIIDKVIKLMATAADGSFPEEAESAGRMAAKLMAKYSIEESEIKREDFIIRTIDTGRKMLDKVEVGLMNALGRFTGAALYTRGSTAWKRGRTNNAVFILVGRPHDIEAAIYMFDILKPQMEAALAKYRKNAGLKYTEMTLRAKGNFRRGFLYGVKNKIFGLINMQNEQIREWGLVPVSVAKTAESWYEAQNKIRKGRAMKGGWSSAGLQAGENASIHKGISKESNTRLQIGN